MRRLAFFSSLLGLALTPQAGRAQQSDLVSWNWASVRLQPDSSRWALELAPNYVAYHNLTRTFLREGQARVSFAWPRRQLLLCLVYTAGTADQLGRLRLAQLQLGQARTTGALRPRWQLSLDRLWFTPANYEGAQRLPTYRVRTLVGIVPQLSPRLGLVLNTEPFVYRTDTWAKHVRSQIGLQFRSRKGITAQALYWNWWTGYEPRRVRWQHTALLTATFPVTKMPLPGHPH